MTTESKAKETKIVKAAPKSHEDHHEDEPRVTVKAAAKPHMRTQ